MEIQFNAILIIESLPPGEQPKTGEELFKHLMSRDGLPVFVALEQPQTADELFAVLDRAALHAEAGGWVPIIHFEMHGTPERDAVVTGSGERIAWNDIAEPLRHLNIAVRNSLIVILGVCSGAFIGIAAANSPFEPAPFAWLIGPNRTVLNFFLPIGFKAFYAELLASGNFGKAVAELRRRTLPEYTALDTAALFRRGRELYETTQTRGGVLNQRVKRVFRKSRATLVSQYGSNNKARVALARHMQDREQWHDYYRHFIMADRFPENERRFPPVDTKVDLEPVQ